MSTAPEMRAATEAMRLDGLVGEHPATASQVAAHLELAAGGPVQVTVNSPGGSAFEGSAIYSELRAHPGAITIVVRGIAASAASLIAMAGDEIVMAEAAVMMLHNPSGATFGTADDHRETVEVLDKLSAEYAGIYAGRSGQPLTTVRRLMAQETWLTAEEAVAAGFADRVEETDAPEPVAAFNYSKFENAPRRLVAMAREYGWTDDRQSEAAHSKEYEKMSTEPKATAAPSKIAKLDPAAQAALDEKERRSAVMAIGSVSMLSPLEVEGIVAEASDPADAKSKAVDLVCEKRMADEPSPTARGTVGHSWDTGAGFRDRAVDCLMSLIDRKHEPKARRGMAENLSDLAMLCVKESGLKPANRAQAISMAITRSDLPLHTADAMSNLIARDIPQRLPDLTRVSVEKIRDTYHQGRSLGLSGTAMPGEVNESAELKHTAFTEAGELLPTPRDFGMIFAFSTKVVQDNQLDLIEAARQRMMQGAVERFRAVLIEPLSANAGLGQDMVDTNPMFHSSHGNVAGTGAALSVASLTEARLAMRTQTDAQGNLLALTPTHLLVPAALETDAQQLLASIDATAVADVNPFAGTLELVVEPALDAVSATAWYLVADPSRWEGLAHAFLESQTTPRVEQRDAWNTLGTELRLVWHLDAKFIETATWWRNAGA